MIWENGQIHDGQLDAYLQESKGGWIYEVVRVIDETPVFLPEHLERLSNSAKATGLKISLPQKDIIKGLYEIIRIDKRKQGNIRLQANIDKGKLSLGFIPHKYPDQEDYEKGIAVELAYLERENPGIKTWNQYVRKSSDRIIREKKVYEVILCTSDGFLLEGSRSNLFGLQKGVLKTPRIENVLPGITRQKVLELAKEYCIPVKETPIHKEEIFSFQSFFITGTSPGLLPVNRIGNTHYNCVSTPCTILRKAYNNKVKESINYARKNLRF